MGENCTYQRRAHRFDLAQVLRMARGRYDILHEAVTLNTEAERGSVGQAQDAQRRGDIGQSEREEVSDLQCGCHDQKVFELVSGTFLHLSHRHWDHKSKNCKQQRQTLSLVAVLGSMTLRMSRVS
jgi:hypothetical protein